MRFVIWLFVLFPLITFSQISFNSEDPFTLNNPSSNADKKLVTTGLFALNNFGDLNYFSSFINHKQKVRSVSVGFNTEFVKFSQFITSKSEMQLGYTYQINRKLTLNSGIGLNLRTDNFSSSNSWNPAYFGLNAGLNLVSKKWQIGFSMVNLNQGNRMIDTLKFRVPSYASLFGSYDFKLDSLGKFHLVPSFYMEVGPTGFYSSLFNIKFNISNHSTGLSYSRYQPSFFYQFLFKNGINLGISIGNNTSILYNNYFKSWNGMVRFNYTLKLKQYRTIGTPSF